MNKAFIFALFLMGSAFGIGLTSCKPSPSVEEKKIEEPAPPAAAKPVKKAAQTPLLKETKTPQVKKQAATVYYVCPMHPAIRFDTKDRCPKCNMHLVQEHKPEEVVGDVD